MKGDIRCVEGTLYRHDPQHDDPYCETARGKCQKCDGKGCPEPRPNLFDILPRGSWSAEGMVKEVNGHSLWCGEVQVERQRFPRLAYIQATGHCGGYDNEQTAAIAHVMAASRDMLAALYEAEEALENYADADQPPGERPIPNAAMSALVEVKHAIAKAEGGET